MTGGIYRIKNLENGKCYIGSSRDLDSRWKLHVRLLNRGRHHSRHLQSAWLKHGPEFFVFDVIEICPNQSELVPREQYWIDTTSPEYNICVKAGSRLGSRWSEESRKKMSDKTKGVPWSQARRDAHKSHWLGRTHSEETKDALRKLNSGRVHSAEVRARMSASQKGKKIGEATKAKLSKAGMRPCSEETKKKISAANTGKVRGSLPSETKKKISAALKGKKSYVRTEESVRRWRETFFSNQQQAQQ